MSFLINAAITIISGIFALGVLACAIWVTAQGVYAVKDWNRRRKGIPLVNKGYRVSEKGPVSGYYVSVGGHEIGMDNKRLAEALTLPAYEFKNPVDDTRSV